MHDLVKDIVGFLKMLKRGLCENMKLVKLKSSSSRGTFVVTGSERRGSSFLRS